MSSENTFSSIDYRAEIGRSVREKLPYFITGLAVVAIAGMLGIIFSVRFGSPYIREMWNDLKPKMSATAPVRKASKPVKTAPKENGQISAIQSGKVTIKGTKYIIKPGDTLASIAEEAYGDASLWTRIAEANGLTADSLIHADNPLTIPR